MARIVLLSWGSHGDVLPCVALAHALRVAGHAVLIGAQPYHAAFVRSHGLDFHALGGETSVARYQQLMDDLIAETNPRKQLRDLLQTLLLPDLEAQYQDALAAVAQADLVIAHWMQLAGMMAAETLGCACVSFSLNPVGIGVVAEGRAADASRHLGKMLSDAIWGDEFHRFRALHRLPPVASVADYQYSKPLNLLAVSPALLPEHADFEPQHRVTGFWHAPEAAAWTPAEPLRAFLNAPGGSAPVVFTFGSMGGRAAEMSALVVAAVARVGCRAILQGGWAGLVAEGGAGGAGGQILCVDYVPHDFLFSHAACVVHHGGAGVTASALRAGVPSVIVWHMLDQPYWGHLLANQGLGPKPLARHGLRSDELAERIDEVLESPFYRERCAGMANRLFHENGVVSAVGEISRLLEAMPVHHGGNVPVMSPITP